MKHCLWLLSEATYNNLPEMGYWITWWYKATFSATKLIHDSCEDRKRPKIWDNILTAWLSKAKANKTSTLCIISLRAMYGGNDIFRRKMNLQKGCRTTKFYHEMLLKYGHDNSSFSKVAKKRRWRPDSKRLSENGHCISCYLAASVHSLHIL